MSDDGHHGKRSSPNGSVSDHSEEKKAVYRSRSNEGGSPPRSRSPSIHKPSSRRGKGYSRSRSRSRSYHKSYKASGKYRSRSRSKERKYKSRYSHSRSRSRSRSGSYSPHSRRRERSHSRSPMSNRRRHNGNRNGYYSAEERKHAYYQEQQNRENPQPSRCLGVFGLSIYTTEQQLHHIFSKYGPVERVQVVIDAKSGRSRGFCFVYFESHEDAKVAKDQCTGMEIDGRRIRVDYSITQRAHTPTPGIYMGKPTFIDDRGWGRQRDYGYGDYYGGGGYRNSYRRSPSPYYSRRRSRYERSRSRSYSPRRY
ncbi:transformer-2 protein homolog beta-like isoform X2 [Homalodisca vitripennis]|uniref:transformer-2 protein homolog beta-like isoform X2 n=1 Tax=Homalodisca vitripennis TaxID=197043 RepID=UPI001EEB5F1B|nr:transformer-2 protein homolog beta-like isoform X2 [Homalodisca vitripennis]